MQYFKSSRQSLAFLILVDSTYYWIKWSSSTCSSSLRDYFCKAVCSSDCCCMWCILCRPYQATLLTTLLFDPIIKVNQSQIFMTVTACLSLCLKSLNDFQQKEPWICYIRASLIECTWMSKLLLLRWIFSWIKIFVQRKTMKTRNQE